MKNSRFDTRLPWIFILIGGAASSCDGRIGSIPDGSVPVELEPQGLSAYHVTRAVDCGVPGHCSKTADPHYSYGYAPSIVRDNGQYYMFFCTPPQNDPAWDVIRLVTSADGYNWSKPKVAIHARRDGTWEDLAACDPSVVFFNGYYYMYYSSAIVTHATHGEADVFQTVIQVARSSHIGGPYATYTKRGSWEVFPGDPKMIILPKIMRQVPNYYGAGQTTVVAKDGILRMWYTDDTVGSSPDRQKLHYVASADPTFPNYAQSTPVSAAGAMGSVVVRYDPRRQRYVVYGVRNQHRANSYLAIATSRDGVSWSGFSTVRDASHFPDFAHNIGVSADRTGTVINGAPQLVGFGAPSWVANQEHGQDSWARWDLFVMRLPAPPGEPAPQDCSGCLGSFGPGATCATACQTVGYPAGGYCAVPGSTNPNSCCSCYTHGSPPSGDCSSCVPAGHSCETACKAAFGTNYTGVCGNPGSTDPSNCCACSRTSSPPEPPRECSGCITTGSSCAEACRATFGSNWTGTCGNPGSTDPNNCCACTATNPPPTTGDRAPIGVLDGVQNGVAWGWACDQDNPNAHVEVHLYVGGAWDSGAPGHALTANLASEAAVSSACGGGSAHRFRFSIPNWSSKQGQPVYAYGINSTAGGSSSHLSGSPRTLN